MGSSEPLDDALADGYMSLGRLDEAIAEYERGLKLFPGMARARFHLAEAYRRKAIPLRPRRNSANFSNCGSMAIPICRKLPKLAGGPGSRLQAGCYNKIWRQNLQFSMKPVL
jgi:tetratricopeptide (TPR) repeat protein